MEGPPGGRPKAIDIWEHVTVLEDLEGKFRGKRVKCKYCGLVFAASANRIKSHIYKIKGQGVRICTGLPPPNNTGSNKGVITDFMENRRDSQGLSNLDRPRDYYKLNEAMLDCYMSPKSMWDGIKAFHTEPKPLEKIQIGPFLVSNTMDERDLQLIQYVFEHLCETNTVFSSSRSFLKQAEFTTLKPKTLLLSVVIDIFAEILTDIERKKKTVPLNWYLPLIFSNAALNGDESSFLDFVEKQKIKENYMSDLKYCDKMFIPVHVGTNSHGHFYLYIVHLKNQEVEIWDSLLDQFIDEKERDDKTKNLMLAMEKLFMNVEFTKFHQIVANTILLQPNEYDCGIFVINFMQQSNNYVKRNPLFQFDSEQERMDLAIKLLKSDLNEQKEILYNKVVKRHFSQGENEENSELSGFKRKQVNTCEAFLQDVGRKAYIELDHSDRRIKRNNVGMKTGFSKGYIIPTTNLVGSIFEDFTEQIWEWIMDYEVLAIGIWGMGGSGKTALATHIHNKLLEEDGGEFDHVIWVTASQHTSICQMQKVVARSINLDISDEYEVKRIAGKLLQAFKCMNKCVVILDDVWDHIFLDEVGIPILDNKIKLILTTRLLEVCQGMDCKEDNIITVEPLSGEDSWALFENTLGVHEQLPMDVEEIAEDMIVKYCDGLPLAIVTIARSMKGKKYVWEWRCMLECLNLDYGQCGIDKWVFPVLRSSYAFLSNKLQRYFLYFALSVEQYFDDAYAKNLTRRFVYEEWTDETEKLMSQYNEGYNMLEKLKNNSILQENCGIGWRMHNLVRIMAIGIAQDTSKIMAKAHMSLTEIPHDSKWKENLQKVFLTGNKIKEIPNGTSPKWSQLSTLLLDDNDDLKLISDDFFNNIPALKVLDLSKTGIEHLPKSVSNLECLTALLLSECEELSYMPSLAKLQRLISLDLSFTAITQAPFGMELLVNLRRLNLLGTRLLKMSASLVSKMTNLECLELNCIPNSMDVRAQDIQDLQKMRVISANFCNIEQFNEYVMSFLDKVHADIIYHLSTIESQTSTQRFRPFDSLNGGIFEDETSRKRVVLEGMDFGDRVLVLPENINELVLLNCFQQIGPSGLCSVLSFGKKNSLQQIKLLTIGGFNEVEYLFCFSHSCPFCSAVQIINELSFSCLNFLKNIVSPLAPSLHESTLFSNLKKLKIQYCNNMKTLLTLELLECLQNLEIISVGGCELMEEIVGEDHFGLLLPDSGNVSDHTITLPKLRSMILWDSPELNFVYRGMMLCPSLECFDAYKCKKLNDPQIKISNGSPLVEWNRNDDLRDFWWHRRWCL